MAPLPVELFVNNLKNIFKQLEAKHTPIQCIEIANLATSHCNNDFSINSPIYGSIKHNTDIIKSLMFKKPVKVQFTFFAATFYLVFVEIDEYKKYENSVDYYYQNKCIRIDDIFEHSFIIDHQLVMLE